MLYLHNILHLNVTSFITTWQNGHMRLKEAWLLSVNMNGRRLVMNITDIPAYIWHSWKDWRLDIDLYVATEPEIHSHHLPAVLCNKRTVLWWELCVKYCHICWTFIVRCDSQVMKALSYDEVTEVTEVTEMRVMS